MSLIRKLFGRSARLERRLAREYVPKLQKELGMSHEEARAHFVTFFRQAERESAASASPEISANYGDWLLERESSDENAFLFISARRNDEVDDADIRWWWNLGDIERRIVVQADEKFRFTQLIYGIKNGMSEAEAADRVRKQCPIFGDPDDRSKASGDDRPLPDELRKRIEDYRKERLECDPEKFVSEMDRASSFNALIREAIRNGWL